ncbi:MAG: restriction endonuclease [Deltaproteobacteria bacterium]|nr:restriction endonuclease [Deltaproteobacteria bacterium]
MNEADPNVIRIQEYDPSFLPADTMTLTFGEQLWRTFGKYLSVEFPNPKTDMQWKLCSQGWVGHIPLSDELVLYLVPKTSIGNLFRMLEWAYNLESFHIFEGLTSSSSLDDVYQRLAKILARRVLDRGRKGLYREYQREKERLPYLRGRVDMGRAMLRPWQATFPCRYEDHNADNEDNRILAWTLFAIARSGICRGDSLSVVRQAFLQLRGAARVEPQLPKVCIGRFYNRLNNDYSPLHALCRFFLEQMGPGHDWGERTMIPFLVNMGRLYELFVARWLDHHLDETWRLKAQERVTFDENEALRMNIDLVVEEADTDRVLCVIDTKYKVSDQAAKADIYEVVAYAEAKNCEKAFLVYPEPLIHPLDMEIGRIRIKSLVFGLSDDLDNQGQAFLDALYGELATCQVQFMEDYDSTNY